MKVAVVGAGFAGLAIVWNLLEQKHSVTLIDEKGIGAGASGISTGLLHPFPGRYAKLSWRADEGMQEAEKLLQIANQDKKVFEKTGILRFAFNPEQEEDFKKRNLWSEEHQGMWIPNGMTVYSRLYLEELYKKCEGVTFLKQKVESLSELSSYDAIVLTCGASILKFTSLPVNYTIGQTLLCRWTQRLPYSLVSLGHISPTEHPEFCQVGSTYEHTEKPDPKKALELIDKVALFYPPAKDFKIEEIRRGVRVCPNVGYQPLAQKIGPKTWVFTGLGSRGLLYHALLARSIVSHMTNNQ